MTRYEQLTQAIEHYGISDDEDASDYDITHASEDECPQWLSVTESATGECRYGQLHLSYSEARLRSTHYCGDSISAEYPIAIVDLDTGTAVTPTWAHLPFH